MMVAICAGLLGTLLCIDMGVKQYIEETFRHGEERKTIIPGIVLRKVYNKGFAFNILDDTPEIVRRASALSVIWVVVYDIYLLLRKKRYAKKIGMTLITAGALGNTYDRLIRGKVIDYIGFDGLEKETDEKEEKQKKFSFPFRITANLSDLYLLAGAVILDLATGHEKRAKARLRKKKQNTAKQTAKQTKK